MTLLEEVDRNLEGWDLLALQTPMDDKRIPLPCGCLEGLWTCLRCGKCERTLAVRSRECNHSSLLNGGKNEEKTDRAFLRPVSE